VTRAPLPTTTPPTQADALRLALASAPLDLVDDVSAQITAEVAAAARGEGVAAAGEGRVAEACARGRRRRSKPAAERRLDRRVEEALDEDREAVRARRAERSLNRRLRAAGVT
jgi:hypothetical protein